MRGSIGSASVVLLFAVLGLSIFTTIVYMSATMEERLIQGEIERIKAFYEADTLAEQVLAEILQDSTYLTYVLGVEISAEWDRDLLAERIMFSIPIPDTAELFVEVVIFENSYKIYSWVVRQVTEWELDDRLNVWPGF